MTKKRLVIENWYRFMNEDFSREELQDMAMKDREGTLAIMQSLEILQQLKKELLQLQSAVADPASQTSLEEVAHEIEKIYEGITELEEVIKTEVHQIDQRK